MGAAALADLDWPYVTRRLQLRPVLTGDIDALFALRSDPEVGRFISRLETDPDEFSARMLDAERLETTLVIEREGQAIGDLYVRVSDAWAQREVAEQARNTQATVGWLDGFVYALLSDEWRASRS